MIRRPPRSTLFPYTNALPISAVSTLPDVRILDRATAPDRPDRNWTPLFACASFVVSLGLAVFSVVMLDGLVHKVNTARPRDRKSTRLNSSHLVISYDGFCLKQ